MAELTEVEVRAELQDLATAKRDASDLAWEHARTAAAAVGISMNDDNFGALYRALDDTYTGLTDHLEFMMFNALVLLRALLETDELALTATTPVKDTEIADLLGSLAQKVISSYAWMIAGHKVAAWPTNEEMPVAGVAFRFPSEDITITHPEA